MSSHEAGVVLPLTAPSSVWEQSGFPGSVQKGLPWLPGCLGSCIVQSGEEGSPLVVGRNPCAHPEAPLKALWLQGQSQPMARCQALTLSLPTGAAT